MHRSLIANVIALVASFSCGAASTATPVQLAPRATSTALCPTYNGKKYQDANGASYAVTCYNTNNGNVIATTGDPVNLGQCMEACDQESGCTAALFHMGVNMCYLLSSVGTMTSNGNYNIGVKSSSSTTSTASAAASSCSTVQVTFNELVTTSWQQSVMLVGSISQLGNWNPNSGVSLSASGYTSSNPLWSATVGLPAGTTFQYKYVVIGVDGTVTWEADPNQSYTVPSNACSATEADSWQSVSSVSSSSATLASTVKNTISATSTTSVAATSTCTNGPNSRNCWSGGYDIDTDFDTAWPTTGRTVSYSWTITNITMAPDGYSRHVLAVNGQYPGPVLEANWGDQISVTVTNNMPNNGTTIHWHGIRQHNNNGQDGVPGVTECPLAPGQTKTYTFQATQYGSSWYHSHFSSQYGDGILGPIVSLPQSMMRVNIR